MKQIQAGKQKLLFLSLVWIALLVASPIGVRSSTTTLGVKEGQEIIFIVDEFNIQINKSTGEKTDIKSFSLAGVSNINPGNATNFTLMIVSADDTKGIDYKIRYNESESQTLNTNSSTIDQLPDFINNYWKNFGNYTDLTTIFPFVLPVTGKTDPLWNRLNGELFRNNSYDKTGVYKDFLSIDLIRPPTDLFASVISQGHYYFTYNITSGLLDHVSLNVEASWDEGTTLVSARSNLYIRMYYPRNTNIPGYELPVITLSIITVAILKKKMRRIN